MDLVDILFCCISSFYGGATGLSGYFFSVGLLAPSNLPSELDRSPEEPSLADLTKIALEVLMRQGKGFFLYVEGGPTTKISSSRESR